ncbi:hypothetical protein ABKA04_005203 [Annulohypoxylon sp. FPYF3050]
MAEQPGLPYSPTLEPEVICMCQDLDLEPLGEDDYPLTESQCEHVWAVLMGRSYPPAPVPRASDYTDIEFVPFTCCECGEIFETEAAIESHLTTHLGLSCHWTFCQFDANNEEELRQHLMDHNKSIASVVGTPEAHLTCHWYGAAHICGKMFADQQSLHNHIQRHNFDGQLVLEFGEEEYENLLGLWD